MGLKPFIKENFNSIERADMHFKNIYL